MDTPSVPQLEVARPATYTVYASPRRAAASSPGDTDRPALVSVYTPSVPAVNVLVAAVDAATPTTATATGPHQLLLSSEASTTKRNNTEHMLELSEPSVSTSIPTKIWYAPHGKQAYGSEEIAAVVACLEAGWLGGVGGKCTQLFEAQTALTFGKQFGVFVNSGSSANLLALGALQLPRGAQVITPACTFATTVAPIIQLGLKPVFVDVQLGAFVPSVVAIMQVMTSQVRAVMIPNLVGNKCDWATLKRRILDWQTTYAVDPKQHPVWLIEDSCDTLTCTPESDIATTSFYASHMITAGGGGGMVMFNCAKLAKVATTLRDWGRASSGLEEPEVEDMAFRFNARHEVDGIPYDCKFLYTHLGYNFKSTECNAAFGLVQLGKLAAISRYRRDLFERYLHNLADSKPVQCGHLLLPDDSVKPNWLAFPLQLTAQAPKTRKQLLIHLETNQVQTRVLFAGNITRHPAYCKYKRAFAVADLVMAHGFLVGAHQGMTLHDVDRVCALIVNYLTSADPE